MYSITPYTRQQARRIGVEVEPSKRHGKKIDVFRGGQYINSIGAKGMGDYPSYIRSEGKAYADERRRLYHLRASDGPKDSAAYLAKRLLW
jgi:hypothetical protein